MCRAQQLSAVEKSVGAVLHLTDYNDKKLK